MNDRNEMGERMSDEDAAREAERYAAEASPYRGRDDDPGGPDDIDLGPPSMTKWQRDLDDEAIEL